MQPNFFIKYRGIDKQNDSQIDLAALGKSIIGFDKVIKETFKISKIKGDIAVIASKTREGSLIIDILIFFIDKADSIPFDRAIDFLNFLKVVSQETYNQANAFFNAIGNGHKTLNDLVAKYPLDFAMVSLFITILLGRAGKHKKHPDLNDLPEQYAIALHKMIGEGKFRKAFKPFVENEVSAIEVSSDRNFEKKSTIDANNFENYLGEGEKILPDLEDGTTHKISGKVVGMQCSRGDSMKIKIRQKKMSLVAFPPEGKTTKDFDDFYGQNVILEARIERVSLYQKPKLHIIEMDIQQKSLPHFT